MRRPDARRSGTGRLGAILGGGRSSRFGSDKAEAMLAGRPLLAHVAAALAAQCDAVVVVGRDWPGLPRVDDRPGPGLGPLGGLAGALRYAGDHGFSEVLTAPCDIPLLPHDVGERLAPASALAADQPTIGLWRADLAEALATFVATDSRRSIRGWAERCGARAVALGSSLANLNRPEDLAALDRLLGG